MQLRCQFRVTPNIDGCLDRNPPNIERFFGKFSSLVPLSWPLILIFGSISAEAPQTWHPYNDIRCHKRGASGGLRYNFKISKAPLSLPLILRYFFVNFHLWSLDYDPQYWLMFGSILAEALRMWPLEITDFGLNLAEMSIRVTPNIDGCLDRNPIILRGFLVNFHLWCLYRDP